MGTAVPATPASSVSSTQRGSGVGHSCSFDSPKGMLNVQVPCVIEEGVDPTARITRTGDIAPNESLFVETGNPLRIQHDGKPVQTVVFNVDGAIDLILTLDPENNSARLVRSASFTVHLRRGGGDPPLTVDSVAPRVCVQRTMAQFAKSAIGAANSVLVAAISLLTISAGGGAAALLAFGQQTYALIPAILVVFVVVILSGFVGVSWKRRSKEVTRCLTSH